MAWTGSAKQTRRGGPVRGHRSLCGGGYLTVDMWMTTISRSVPMRKSYRQNCVIFTCAFVACYWDAKIGVDYAKVRHNRNFFDSREEAFEEGQ